MTETHEFRLGDMLSLTLQAPLSFRWPVVEDRVMMLMVHMTDGNVDVFRMQDMIDMCSDDLRRQYPWLAGISIPEFVKESRSWAVLYAWLDTLEIKYGEWHAVESVPGASEIEVTDLTGFTFEQLPPEIQARLRQLGYDPEN